MAQIRALTIDPSLRNWGMGRVLIDIDTRQVTVEELFLNKTEDDSGKVVRKNSDDLRRAKALYDEMVRFSQGCSIAFAEVPVGSQSARAMASYGVCIGVLAGCPLPLIQVTPTEVKLAGFGYKHATKEEMIQWATEKHPEANWLMKKRGGALTPTNDNEHLADAIGAVYAGIKTDQFRQAVAMLRSMGVAAAIPGNPSI